MRSVQGIQSFAGVLVQALIADRLQRTIGGWQAAQARRKIWGEWRRSRFGVHELIRKGPIDRQSAIRPSSQRERL
jgi:hypothetical protein